MEICPVPGMKTGGRVSKKFNNLMMNSLFWELSDFLEKLLKFSNEFEFLNKSKFSNEFEISNKFKTSNEFKFSNKFEFPNEFGINLRMISIKRRNSNFRVKLNIR